MTSIKFYSSVNLCLFLLWSSFLFFVPKKASVEELSRSLNQALIERNENQLNLLLHEDLSYGHSNAWVESKEELIRNNRSKYLVYENINIDSVNVKYIDDIAILRCHSKIQVILNGKNLSLKLYICQVWIKTKGNWKLLTRQSTRLE